MSKHTPGPWYYCQVERKVKSVANMRHEDGRSDFVIARVPHRSSDYPISHDEHKANSQLLAASPELLAALEELVKECIDEGWEEEAPDSGGAFEQAIQLIAKAKGVE
jgi:hypothetical protein